MTVLDQMYTPTFQGMFVAWRGMSLTKKNQNYITISSLGLTGTRIHIFSTTIWARHNTNTRLWLFDLLKSFNTIMTVLLSLLFLISLLQPITLALTRFVLFSFIVFTRQLHAGVTLAVGLTFSLVNTPGMVNPPTQVNLLLVSRPFEYNHALSCPVL